MIDIEPTETGTTEFKPIATDSSDIGLAGTGRAAKSPDALLTIGEVTAMLGIKQHVLRYWEEQFSALRPVKRSGGRRYYRPEDIELLRTIHRLVDQQGYTLRGAKQAIEAGHDRDAPPPANAPAGDPAPSAGVGQAGLTDDTIARLRQVRRVLSEALAAS